MKVSRYFHLRRGVYGHQSPFGGGTVKVTGDTEILGQVDVQFAKCSKKDQFIKAIGRAEADKAPVKVIALRYLPRELGILSLESGNKDLLDFGFAIKYFLPKE